MRDQQPTREPAFDIMGGAARHRLLLLAKEAQRRPQKQIKEGRTFRCPVAHGLAGLTVHLLTARNRVELTSARHAAVAVVAAVAPDLDLLLRFVDGRNHPQAESHSIACALTTPAPRSRYSLEQSRFVSFFSWAYFSAEAAIIGLMIC